MSNDQTMNTIYTIIIDRSPIGAFFSADDAIEIALDLDTDDDDNATVILSVGNDQARADLLRGEKVDIVLHREYGNDIVGAIYPTQVLKVRR